MGLWLTLSEPVARSIGYWFLVDSLLLRFKKNVKPWLPQYRGIVVVELSIDLIHWSWGRNLTTFGLQPNRCDQAVFHGSEPPLDCIYQSQQKSKDLPKPFFTVKIHKTHLQKSGTQLAWLRNHSFFRLMIRLVHAFLAEFSATAWEKNIQKFKAASSLKQGDNTLPTYICLEMITTYCWWKKSCTTWDV